MHRSLMKLAAVGMMGLMAVTALARMEMRRHSPDFLIWSLFLFYSMLTSLIAVQPAMALVETSSHLAAFVLLYGMARLLGRVNFINGLIAVVLHFVPDVDLGLCRHAFAGPHERLGEWRLSCRHRACRACSGRPTPPARRRPSGSYSPSFCPISRRPGRSFLRSWPPFRFA